MHNTACAALRHLIKLPGEDWAAIEGGLHRALAAYVHRRTLANSDARPGFIYILSSSNPQMNSLYRSGHPRMQLLKELVAATRNSALEAM